MSSTNINRVNQDSINSYRRDSSSTVNLNQSQRLVPSTSHKKINQNQRGQLSYRCNSGISNSNTFANSSLNLNCNINTSINSLTGNENILSQSLLRSSIVTHSKQLSSGCNTNNNQSSNYCNISGVQPLLSNSSYSRALTSIDACDGSSKSSQNISLISSQNNKQLQSSQQPTIAQLKQNAIKRYNLQQQPTSQQQTTLQQHQQASQGLIQCQNQNAQMPPYYFEKGVSKTHRGHTSSYNNFSYIQQNSSVTHILGNSQKQNSIQATPPNKRVNTMPSQVQAATSLTQINDENAMLTLSSSRNVSTYKVSPHMQKNSQNIQQKASINNYTQNSINITGNSIMNNSNNSSQLLLNCNNNSNSSNNICNLANNLNSSNQFQISAYSNQQNTNNIITNNNTDYNVINIQSNQNQSTSLKRLHSQEEQVSNDEEEDLYLEKMMKEIDGYKQREVQYLSRINSLDQENKQVNESVSKSENNIKILKRELIKYQQQSEKILNNANSQGLQQKNNQISQNNKYEFQNSQNTNTDILLQQKQITMLESYIETMSKKLQQLEMEQIRQQNSNPQQYDKQYLIQKSKYKQLVEKYFTLEKLYDEVSNENEYYKINLDKLKIEHLRRQQSQLQQHNNPNQNHNNQFSINSSVIKALQIVQLGKQ